MVRGSAPRGRPRRATAISTARSRALVAARLPRPRRTTTRSDVVFHHALVQDVAYSRLLRRQRRDLHRRVAEVAESLYGAGDDVVDLLARHCISGRRARRRSTTSFAPASGRGGCTRTRRRSSTSAGRRSSPSASRSCRARPRSCSRSPTSTTSSATTTRRSGCTRTCATRPPTSARGAASPPRIASAASTSDALAVVDEAFATGALDGRRPHAALARAGHDALGRRALEEAIEVLELGLAAAGVTRATARRCSCSSGSLARRSSSGRADDALRHATRSAGAVRGGRRPARAQQHRSPARRHLHDARPARRGRRDPRAGPRARRARGERRGDRRLPDQPRAREARAAARSRRRSPATSGRSPSSSESATAPAARSATRTSPGCSRTRATTTRRSATASRRSSSRARSGTCSSWRRRPTRWPSSGCGGARRRGAPREPRRRPVSSSSSARSPKAAQSLELAAKAWEAAGDEARARETRSRAQPLV